jgi:DNA-binding transcriptional ArsR family regulator
MNETSHQRQARLFRALAHPARLAILSTLRAGEACVCHLEAHLGYRQAYLSQQLAALREAGLVLDRRDGWNVYYRVVEPAVFEVLDTAQRMLGGAVEGDRASKAVVTCSCPKCASSVALVGCP